MTEEIKPAYLIDIAENQGKLDLFVQTDLVATYVYSENLVNLSPRPDFDSLEPDQLKTNIVAIHRWIKFIEKNLSFSLSKISTHEMELKKTDTVFLAKMEMNGKNISNIVFYPEDDLSIFSPREEINLI